MGVATSNAKHYKAYSPVATDAPSDTEDPEPASSPPIRQAAWAVQDFTKYATKSYRHWIKDSLQCKFETLSSSQGCRCEDYLRQNGTGAFAGLHCNWVTPDILAAARPSDQMIHQQKIIEQFKRFGITSIFNLQEPGEHAHCGPGVNMNTGFSYSPELFMQNKISFYNYPWRDMTCPDIDYCLDIVQVMESHLSLGQKVLVHCHSGLGRTGLVIACYLLFARKCIDHDEAVEMVRKCRSGSVQTKHQKHHVGLFENYLKDIRIVYGYPKVFWRTGLDLHGFMSRQHKYLHGTEARKLRYVPKIVFWITKELIRRTNSEREKREEISLTFMAELADYDSKKDVWFSDFVQATKEQVNSGNWDGVEDMDTNSLSYLLIFWLCDLEKPIIPDTLLPVALGRGKISGAIKELCKCDKCSLATIQSLVCWMFQIMPSKASLIRRLYSALAHLLLQHSSLQDKTGRGYFVPGINMSISFNPTLLQHPQLKSVFTLKPQRELKAATTVKRCASYGAADSPYSRFRPSSMENEFGVLLEAAARYWIKESQIATAPELPQEQQGNSLLPNSVLDTGRELHRPKPFLLTFDDNPWMQERRSFKFVS
ncbi:unnamed protein product [Sphagnum tenellum]